MASPDALRTRRSFARLEKVLEVPNLIDIQKKSFDWLVDTENGGLRETIDDISPIEDYTDHLAVQFGEFNFDVPAASTDGGSPGRYFLKSSMSAPFLVFVFSGSASIVLRR